MFGEIDGGSVAAEVVMSLHAGDKCALVVEGVTDHRVLDRHKGDGVALVYANGRENVVRAIDALSRSACRSYAMGVVDYDRGISGLPEAIVSSEHSDFEVDALHVPGVLRAVVGECYGSAFSAVLGRLGLESEGEFLAWLMDICARVGAVRAAAAEVYPGSSLAGWDRWDVIDSGAEVVLLAEAVRRNGGAEVDVRRVVQRAEELFVIPLGRHELARGHDVTRVIAVIGRHRFGVRGCGREKVESALRLAVGCAEFGALPVTSRLQEWATSSSLELWHKVPAHVAA